MNKRRRLVSLSYVGVILACQNLLPNTYYVLRTLPTALLSIVYYPVPSVQYMSDEEAACQTKYQEQG